ncbi:MAG TPA: cytochrome c-type biogenesis CcmF C-terminal domain-containing protein, partial [Solirubrobacterales bacterium]|nr:cytochrome c-type biogenesis CcmF C-terminal domain-containing protein [Solirubrobacterales bacterium]
QQPTTEVAMRQTLSEDLYLVLGSHDPASGVVTILAYVNPLVGWIWIGALIAVSGALMAAWPALESRRRLEAAYRARLGKELGTASPPA